MVDWETNLSLALGVGNNLSVAIGTDCLGTDCLGPGTFGADDCHSW